MPCVAISPLVGGRAVKGPADRMLARLAGGTTPAHVAACYEGLIDVLVIDESDDAGRPGARCEADGGHADAHVRRERARASSPQLPSTLRGRSHESRDSRRHRQLRPRAGRAARGARRADDVVIGSRDEARARETAAELGSGRVTGATNEHAVGGAELVVLAVKADSALATAQAVAGPLGSTPLLSVASAIEFHKGVGMFPDPDALSLAERVQAVVGAPVAAGLHSIAAANLGAEQVDEDALICGDDMRAKELAIEFAGRLVGGRRARRGAARERPRARGDDGGDRQPEPPLQGTCRRPHHRRRRRGVITLLPVRGLPEIREGDDLAAMIVGLVELADDDVLVIAQKAVSKAEGRVIRIDSLEASGACDRARR